MWEVKQAVSSDALVNYFIASSGLATEAGDMILLVLRTNEHGQEGHAVRPGTENISSCPQYTGSHAKCKLSLSGLKSSSLINRGRQKHECNYTVSCNYTVQSRPSSCEFLIINVCVCVSVQWCTIYCMA